MTRAKISQLDAAAANNTDINAVNVAEGCPPSGINNAIREMGAMLKRMDNGTDHLTDPNITGSLDVDNINIDGNTISSSNTNGNINITPNGTGAVAFTTNATFGDNDKAIFGAGSDLQISHNGSYSLIADSGTGNLILACQDFSLTNPAVGENMITAAVDGAVTLYYDNGVKLATTNTGVDVTGGVVASGGLSINSYGDPSNNYITLRPSFAPSASGGVGFAAKDHDGANNDGLGVFGHDGISFTTGGSERMRIDSSGNVLIGDSAPQVVSKLTVSGNGSADTGTFMYDGSAGTYFDINTNAANGTVDLEANARTGGFPPLTFTTGGSERLRIDSSGNVGIGTSPSQLLHLSSSSPRIRINHTSGAIAYVDAATNGVLEFVADDTNVAANSSMRFKVDGSEAMRIDSSGSVGIGTTVTGDAELVVYGADAATIYKNTNTGTGTGDGFFVGLAKSNGTDAYVYQRENTNLIFGTNNAERMRILSGGAVTVSGDADESPYNNSGDDPATVLNAFNAGLFSAARHNGDPAAFNRTGSDGAIVTFYQDGTAEGSINVSGSTVSLLGGHLSRWSQTSDGSKDTGIVRGTVMTNLNEMCEWKQVSFDYVITDDEGNQRIIPKKTGYGGDADVGQTVTVQFEGSDVSGTVVAEDNEQLNRMAVSSVEGDVNVAGVMDSWDEDDDNYDDMTIAMTGDFVIRIAQGTTVARGDLLMSAGDGTAKPQGEDIVRSKTIAKVTSTHISHTYDDGSYLVPCVLMAC